MEDRGGEVTVEAITTAALQRIAGARREPRQVAMYRAGDLALRAYFVGLVIRASGSSSTAPSQQP